MGLIEKLGKLFPPSEYPAHYHMEDSGPPRSADFTPMTADVFREPPLPDDPEERDRRLRIRDSLFEAAFKMPGWDESTQGRSPIPFYEKSPDEVEQMPDDLRASYLAERAAAADPRSGPRLVPYQEPPAQG